MQVFETLFYFCLKEDGQQAIEILGKRHCKSAFLQKKSRLTMSFLVSTESVETCQNSYVDFYRNNERSKSGECRLEINTINTAQCDCK